ncbi:hypothetical protein IKE71_04095 [Candidatus Saccharibacteria bacterium]|nr:hypothetical protein [Candidatus Saccharibacteria bacterium]
MTKKTNLTSDLLTIIEESKKDKTKAYDTQADVTRVEGSTAWVHIPGGIDETPVKKTISAKAGDKVQVRVAGGTAWLVGNATNPPTDDTAALRAEASADKANEMATSATRSANMAAEAASTATSAASTALSKAEEAEDAASAASTAAATADQKATAAGTAAAAAQTSADNAATAAATADSKATAASAAATRAETKADTASAAASRAETAAGNAETAAASAQTSADSALVGLSTVQDVVGVLNWITAHGTMTSQSGGTFDDNQVYFIQDNNGDYTVGGVRYSLVAEPKAADINSYYVLSVDESVQNYVATHIVVDSEGLWIIPDAGGNKVLIATGNGSSYTTAGTYIIGKVNNVDKVLAKFITTGATVGQIDGAHSIIDADGQRFYASDGTTQLANIGYGQGASESGTATAPYYTLGTRNTSNTIGNYSMAEGYNSTARGYTSHAEGYETMASAHESHAEGLETTASGMASHAEGEATIASGFRAHAEGGAAIASGSNSHAQNFGTIAAQIYQTAIGKYNVEDTETTASKQKALIIGNGTSDTARSNAFTVDWSGNTEAAGDITDGGGNVLADKADSSSLATVATTGSYDDLLNLPALATVATTGSYNDLSNKPTIPTVNDATLTIQKNGTNVQTFTANAASNKTANITVPTKTSDLTNDSGFITSVPTPSARTATNTSAYTLTNSAAKVTLANKAYCGSNTSISSGGIKCAVAGTVEVSCTARFYPVNDADLCRLDIYKGSSSQYFSAGRAGGNTENISISPVLLDVAAGDVIYLYAQNGTAARGSISANSAFLTVKYIDE